jgi:hypothetical protein
VVAPRAFQRTAFRCGREECTGCVVDGLGIGEAGPGSTHLLVGRPPAPVELVQTRRRRQGAQPRLLGTQRRDGGVRAGDLVRRGRHLRQQGGDPRPQRRQRDHAPVRVGDGVVRGVGVGAQLLGQ